MTDVKHTFHVQGMHCASCVFFLEETLPGNAGVREAKANLATCTVTLHGDLPDDRTAIADALNPLIAKNGYQLVHEPSASPTAATRDFLIAAPAAALVILGFVALQKLGIVNLVSNGDANYGTALLIGVIASLSTCLAVVGGLVLSVSANAAKNNATWKSQTLFHAGRLGGFFLLGGVIGSAGAVFQLGIVGTFVLSLLVGAVMLILGVNLLDVFPSLKKLQPKMPTAITRRTMRSTSSTHMLAPLLLGIGTFFLPCGFTQSMQVYTLSTGSFLSGALTMLFFALGTLPVLALLSFGALEIAHKPWKGIFFKAAGIVVIVLAIYNIWNALAVIGIN